MRLPKIQMPTIAEPEKTPLVLQLVDIIEQQAVVIQQQAEENQLLKDEIARLKGEKPKPVIRPSTLEKDSDDDVKKKASSDRRPGSDKRSKTAEITIHQTITIPPANIPPGSQKKGYQTYTVIGICIKPHNICYNLERWETPDGKYIIGQLPPDVVGHFSAELKRYILYQHYQCLVTQPLILEHLTELNIDISAGQISRILTEDKDIFHREKDGLLAAAINGSSYIQADDTGARHKGKNGYCTHIGNELFAWFESTNSKSRINFLELLCAGQNGYVINADALEYMNNQGLAKFVIGLLKNHSIKQFADITAWETHLADLQITNHRHIKIATEGALIGSILHNGLPRSLVIISDDAGQFNVFNHSLCWIHAERLLKKLVAPSDEKRQILETVREQIWEFYRELKAYKICPNESDKSRLKAKFCDIFTQKTGYQMLDLALERLYGNMDELLLVLERPEIPLHNNLSERDIREYVKRRKISGSTRSDLGRRCRDTFTSLKKTCRKLGVSFWEYLLDRLSNKNEILPLSEIIQNRANPP